MLGRYGQTTSLDAAKAAGPRMSMEGLHPMTDDKRRSRNGYGRVMQVKSLIEHDQAATRFVLTARGRAVLATMLGGSDERESSAQSRKLRSTRRIGALQVLAIMGAGDYRRPQDHVPSEGSVDDGGALHQIHFCLP